MRTPQNYYYIYCIHLMISKVSIKTNGYNEYFIKEIEYEIPYNVKTFDF